MHGTASRPSASKRRTRGGCAVDDCVRPHSAKGYCNLHYQRFLRWGDPNGGTSRILPEPERFMLLVDKDGPTPAVFRGRGPCWQWRLKPNKQTGYGYFRPGRNKRWLAHRYSYELHVGPIPSGLQIDHLCRNRRCVNPAHLEPVTSGENTDRGLSVSTFNKLKKACPAGHEYTPENTYRPPSKPNSRRCRACMRIQDRQPARLARKRQLRKAA